jgi:hypothetical protein
MANWWDSYPDAPEQAQTKSKQPPPQEDEGFLQRLNKGVAAGGLSTLAIPNGIANLASQVLGFGTPFIGPQRATQMVEPDPAAQASFPFILGQNLTGLLTGGVVGALGRSPTLARALLPNTAGEAAMQGLTALTGSAGEYAGNKIGGDTGRVIGGLVGSMAPPVATGTAARMMIGNPEQYRENLARLENAGIRPTIPAASTNPAMRAIGATDVFIDPFNVARRRMAEQSAQYQQAAQRLGLTTQPKAEVGQLLRNAVDRYGSDVQRQVENTLSGLGMSVSPKAELGEIAQRAREALQNQIASDASNIYGDFFKKVPGTTPILPAETTAVAREILNRGGEFSQDVAPLATRLAAGFTSATNPIPLDDLQIIRSRIGYLLRGAQNPADRGALKQLYGALTTDRALQMPTPELSQELSGLDAQYKNWQKQLETAHNLFSADTPDTLANQLLNAVKNRGSDLKTALQYIAPEDRDALRAHYLQRLFTTTNTGGDFTAPPSLTTFAQNWRKIDPTAKQVVFGDNPAQLTQLDALAGARGRLPIHDTAQAYEDLAKRFTKNRTDDQLFNEFISSARQKGGDIERLWPYLNPDEQEAVKGNLKNRLFTTRSMQGDVAGVEKNADIFPSEWDKLSAEAKNAMFAPQELNQLENMKTLSKQLAPFIRDPDSFRTTVARAANWSSLLPPPVVAAGALAGHLPLALVGGGALLATPFITSSPTLARAVANPYLTLPPSALQEALRLGLNTNAAPDQ